MPALDFNTFFQRICETTPLTSQAGLADFLGISRAAITQAKRNNTIPKTWIYKLSHRFKVNPAWLEKGIRPKLSNQNNYDDIFLQVPKIRARLSAGGGSFETEPEVSEFYSFRNDWLSKKGRSEDMILMDVNGNSMEPELREGDTVLIDQSQNAVLAGAIYAVGLADTIVVKRLEKRPEELLLISENGAYPPICFRGEQMNSIRIIGKVIWICREIH